MKLVKHTQTAEYYNWSDLDGDHTYHSVTLIRGSEGVLASVFRGVVDIKSGETITDTKIHCWPDRAEWRDEVSNWRKTITLNNNRKQYILNILEGLSVPITDINLDEFFGGLKCQSNFTQTQ